MHTFNRIPREMVKLQSQRLWRGRPGFSFTEILFAVMILGIGFIMVAAIFPVAIKQTALTAEDVRGASMALSSASAMQSLATEQNMPTVFLPSDPDAVGSVGALAPLTIASRVWTFHDPRLNTLADTTVADRMWAAVAGNMIYASDPRYAWIPMYRRDLILQPGADRTTATKSSYYSSPTAQLIMIGVQVRNHPQYQTTRDVQRFNTAFPYGAPQAVLEPIPVSVDITPAGAKYLGSPATVSFKFSTDNPSIHAAEGSYLVISDDGQVYPQDPNGYYSGYNGNILRLGNLRPDLMAPPPSQPVFELAPGYNVNKSLSASVLLIGRGYSNPQNTLGGVDGGVQDIAVYTTFVRIQ